MQITLNGTTHGVADATTLAELLRELGIRPQQVAVEVNRELVPRNRHPSHVLQAGDWVEIVTLVGGG